MSHAEYAPKQLPVLTRLVMTLRQMPAVQTALARLKSLFRSGTNPEPIAIDAFAAGPASDDATEIVDVAIATFDAMPAVAPAAVPAPSETAPEQVVADAPGSDARVIANDAVETDGVTAAAQAPVPLQSEAAAEPVVGAAFLVEPVAAVSEAFETDDPETEEIAAAAAEPVARLANEDVPDPVAVAAFLAHPPVAANDTVEADVVTRAVAQPADESERETLIRRRWRETGMRMWNPGQSVICIQGQVALLPPKPGETMPSYDRLEFKLVDGDIVCEGVVVEPPERPKHPGSGAAY